MALDISETVQPLATPQAPFHVTDILARIVTRKSRVSDVRMYRRFGVAVDVGIVECGLIRSFWSS